jgi:hypothetical protein
MTAGTSAMRAARRRGGLVGGILTQLGEGGITLGAKNLYELIANAPGEEVTLKKGR